MGLGCRVAGFRLKVLSLCFLLFLEVHFFSDRVSSADGCKLPLLRVAFVEASCSRAIYALAKMSRCVSRALAPSKRPVSTRQDLRTLNPLNLEPCKP